MELIQRFKDLGLLLKFNHLIIKMITSISIFMLTVFFTPNFDIVSFPIFLLSSFTILLFDTLVNMILGTDSLSFGKGIIGFTVYAIMIYMTQFLIDGYYISVISTLIASAIYGIIVSMIPNE